MKDNADQLFRYFFHASPAESPYILLWYGLVIFCASLLLLGFAATFAGITSFVERRIAGRIQSRIGPNLVGPQGIVQWIADGIKLLLKEDLIPDSADRILYRLAPYFVFAGLFGVFVVLPFGYGIIAADLNIGILYLIAITALVVVGIIMGGWSSNSKWALFGALRSAAQIISYEIPTGLALLTVVLLSGSLSTQAIITNQGGEPWNWFVFHSPFTMVVCVVLFISTLAEGNRVPFDLPEAESELVAGYNTEYSGFRFVVFFIAEWANIWVTGAILVITFLGGWQIPAVATSAIRGNIPLIALSLIIFSVKTLAVCFLIIQIRWTLPRVRVDQMTLMCWTYLVPIALVCLIGTMAWMLVLPWDSVTATVFRMIMFITGVVIGGWYVYRVIYNYSMDKDNMENFKGVPAWYPPWKLP